jgi:DNA modification methylase
MSKLLKKLEKRIEANQKSVWYENNLLLLKIRDENLYKKKHETFVKYLKSRWGYEESHGYQLMKSAELMQLMTAENLRQNKEKAEVLLPKNEKQTRVLINKLSNNGQRIKVWGDVVGSKEKITAALVQSKVDAFLDSGEVVPDIEYVEEEIIVGKSAKKQSQIEKRKQEIEDTLKADLQTIPSICHKDVNDFLNGVEDNSVDLLITDPPYSTDVDNIEEFAQGWLQNALKKVKDTGYAFVFIGAYPKEIKAYLNIEMPTQLLIWEYKNTLGNNPKNRYKLNYQAILFYRMPKASGLNIDVTGEQWAVHSVNAPDGRQGDRYHTWQKPMELAERLIRHTTEDGNKIIDPFCCTGTFLLAAAKMNRVASGCDISKENLQIAEDRGCIITGEKI